MYQGLNQAEKIAKPSKSGNHETGEFLRYYLKRQRILEEGYVR